MTRIITATAVVAAGALLTACGSSTPPNPATVAAADPTTSATVTAGQTETPTPAATTSPETRVIADDATAAQVADGLGCADYTRAPIKPNQMGPKAVSQGKCTRDGQRYTIAVFKNSDDVTEALLLIKMFSGLLTKPVQIGVNGRWTVTAGGKSLNNVPPIGDGMIGAIRDSGGTIKKVQPSDTL